ncbi:MAG: DUF4360 domain-containing protein [Pseudobdellovibrio sp.]
MKVLMILLAVTIGLSQFAEAQSVTIRGVRMSGTGCSDSTAWATTTADGRTLSVLFDNYMVEIGNGSTNPTSTSSNKKCRILVDVDVPYGYQFGLEQTDYRGFAALPASAYGMHRFTHVVPNQPIASLREAQLQGPVADDYHVVVRQKPGRYVYSPCNKRVQTIELLSELSVAYFPNTRDRSIAQINLDSVDTGVNSSFTLNWRRCQ